jgi:hypothetical protein
MACRRPEPDAGPVRPRPASVWVAMIAATVAAGGRADPVPPWPAAAETNAVANVGVAGGIRLAATANGQAVRCLDGDRGSVTTFDAERPGDRREVVGPRPASSLLGVGCLPGDLVAVVGRTGAAWWLRSYRIEPGVTADPASPLQEIALGEAGPPTEPIGVAVSSSRGWLAVTGLPAPLPPVLRAAVAGVRIGPLSDRSCPALPEGIRPTAAAVGPRDELVLALESRPGIAGAADAAAGIGFYDLAGRERARFATGVHDVRGIAFDRRGSTLCVAGRGIADGRTGLWRLEATMREGRQSVRPVFLADVADPRDLVAGADRTLIMLAGGPDGPILRFDPTPSANADRPAVDPGDAPP